MALKKSLAWMGGAQVLSGLVQFASSVVLARLLTPYETGIYAIALATVGFLGIIQTLGLQALIVREEVLTPEISATAFTVNAAIAGLLSLAILGAAVAGAALFGDPGVGRVLTALAATPLVGIFVFLPASQLERAGRFKAIALIGTMTGIVSAAATMSFAFAGWSYMSIAYGQWVGILSYALLIFWIGRTHLSLRLSLSEWRRVSRFGLQMLAVSGVTAASSRLSDLVLGRVLGLAALGFFARASGMNNLIWGNIHLVIGRVLLVDFADLHRRKVSLRDRYIRTVEISTAVLWPAFAGLAVLSHHIINLIYGNVWVPAANLLILIAIGSIIQVSITMTWELFAATGRLEAQTRIEVVRAALSISLFAGACFISLEAAAATRVIDAIVAVFLYRPHISRMTDTESRDFRSAYLRSALLTILAVGPACVAVVNAPAGEYLSPLLVGLSMASGGLAWATGLLVMKHPIATELLATAKARLR